MLRIFIIIFKILVNFYSNRTYPEKMHENVEQVKYKVLEQIDVYKNNSYTFEKSVTGNEFIENNISNETTYEAILSLLSDKYKYNVIFPKQTTYYQKFNYTKVIIEDLRKIGINIKSIQKILNLANIDETEILHYILFYHTIINLETSTENLVTYNINYDVLMKIVNNFNCKFKKEDITINKYSLKKVIEMCGLTYSERFRYMNFYEVEEKTIKKYQDKDINLKNNNPNKNCSSNDSDDNNNKNQNSNKNNNSNDSDENNNNKNEKQKSNDKNDIEKKHNGIVNLISDNEDVDKNKNGLGSNNTEKNGIDKNQEDFDTKNHDKEKKLIKSKMNNKSKTHNLIKIKKSMNHNKKKSKDYNINNNEDGKEKETKKMMTQKDLLLQRALKDMNSNKNIIYSNVNSKDKNFKLLDSIDNNDEEEIFERNYIFLKTPKRLKNNNNDRYKNTEENLNDTPKFFNEDKNKDNNLKKTIKKKKFLKKTITSAKLRKRKQINKPKLEMNHENTVSYLGRSQELKKQHFEISSGKELMYPFNGYTKYSTSFAINTPEKKVIEVKNKKKDEEYCYYPFILRKRPEINNKVIYLTGSLPKLGNWDPLRAIKMNQEKRNGEEFFSKYIEVQRNEIPFEYKFFYYDDNGKIVWIGLPFENYLTFPQYFESLRGLKKSHISIIDLNIRYINDIDGINIWDNRKSQLIELLLNKRADIFFFQEITRPQSDFIDRYLSSIYEFVGEYRDSSDASEKCSICVNKLKYTIHNHGQFWLSSTPYIPGSNDFGNFFPRICTWASLKQIEGISLLFMNVHLDHVNIDAHLPCVKVLMQEEKKIENQYNDIHFIFIAGCFYSNENDEDIQYIKSQGFTEVIFENTYHAFTGTAFYHWDYMFWKEKNGNNIEFKEAHVMKKEGTIDENRKHYISDHFPIYAEFFLKNTQ